MFSRLEVLVSQLCNCFSFTLLLNLHLFIFIFLCFNRPLSCLLPQLLNLPFFPLQALCEECESCCRSLAELGVGVQEFGEQNPLLCKQLGDAVAKLTEVQRHTTQQVQDRANRLKKVRCQFCLAKQKCAQFCLYI